MLLRTLNAPTPRTHAVTKILAIARLKLDKKREICLNPPG